MIADKNIHICGIDVLKTYPCFQDDYKAPEKHYITDDKGEEWELQIEGIEENKAEEMVITCNECGLTLKEKQ